MSKGEMFDILDERGWKTGTAAGKHIVHQCGLWHAGVHLCITDGRGNIFQQLRGSAPDVRILPDAWDLFAVAGHVSADERPMRTLLRETREELGLELSQATLRANDLEEVSVTRSDYWVEDPAYLHGGYHHRAFDHNYVVRMPDFDPDTLALEDKKVLAVRRYPIRQLQEDLAKSQSSADYLQHAHRPVEDARLYQTVLDRALALGS